MYLSLIIQPLQPSYHSSHLAFKSQINSHAVLYDATFNQKPTRNKIKPSIISKIDWSIVSYLPYPSISKINQFLNLFPLPMYGKPSQFNCGDGTQYIFELKPLNIIERSLEKTINYRFNNKIHFRNIKEMAMNHPRPFPPLSQIIDDVADLREQFTPNKATSKEKLMYSTASKIGKQHDEDTPSGKSIKNKPIFKQGRAFLKKNRFGIRLHYYNPIGQRWLQANLLRQRSVDQIHPFVTHQCTIIGLEQVSLRREAFSPQFQTRYLDFMVQMSKDMIMGHSFMLSASYFERQPEFDSCLEYFYWLWILFLFLQHFFTSRQSNNTTTMTIVALVLMLSFWLKSCSQWSFSLAF